MADTGTFDDLIPPDAPIADFGAVNRADKADRLVPARRAGLGDAALPAVRSHFDPDRYLRDTARNAGPPSGYVVDQPQTWPGTLVSDLKDTPWRNDPVVGNFDPDAYLVGTSDASWAQYPAVKPAAAPGSAQAYFAGESKQLANAMAHRPDGYQTTLEEQLRTAGKKIQSGVNNLRGEEYPVPVARQPVPAMPAARGEWTPGMGTRPLYATDFGRKTLGLPGPAKAGDTQSRTAQNINALADIASGAVGTVIAPATAAVRQATVPIERLTGIPAEKLEGIAAATAPLEQLPIRLTISRICEVCGAFRFGDLIETGGDGLTEASDGECAVLERIRSNFTEKCLELGE